MTNPVTETKSIGLPANAPVVMVFASPSGQLYRDTEILPTYRDFAKTHANPDTDGNSPYHRAVISKPKRQLENDSNVKKSQRLTCHS